MVQARESRENATKSQSHDSRLRNDTGSASHRRTGQMEREMVASSSWSSLFKDPSSDVNSSTPVAPCSRSRSMASTSGTPAAPPSRTDRRCPNLTINAITNVLQIIAVGVSVILGNKLRRRTNLLVCTFAIFFFLIAVGGLGTTHRGGPFSTSVGTTIVVFAYINIVCVNFSIGSLSYTISSEMADSRDRNKVKTCAIDVFFLTVWLMVFVSSYPYYTANLGPMLGFVYADTTLFTLSHVWFCVGETTGRTNMDIDKFFMSRVPVRKWKAYTIVPGGG